jgi:transcriptional regulator with XRE-family HTH domain
MSTPKDPRLTAMLGTPERTIQARKALPNFLDQVTATQLEGAVVEVAAMAGVGQLLQQARHQRSLSIRDAARRMDRSPSRVVAIEQATTEITVATLTRLAQALGYRTEIRLVPMDSDGSDLSARLTVPEEEQPVQDEPRALLKGSVHLPARKARVGV